jgi:pyrroloquinoline quinone biosynthesis protein E
MPDMTEPSSDCPTLAAKARIQVDPLTGASVLLFPEGVLRLNRTGAAIIALCTGTRSLAEIVLELATQWGTESLQVEQSTIAFLSDLRRRRLIRWNAEFSISKPTSNSVFTVDDTQEQLPPLGTRPLGLLAELTYSCPLHCPYCSNPTTLSSQESELSVAEWERVLAEAAGLGILQVHFSGGEPLQFRELVRLVSAARNAGMYTNLLTSGIPLTRPLAEKLREAGLDHVQLSFQSDEVVSADGMAGVAAHAAKLSAARLVSELGWPLTVNVVLHRQNIERVQQLIEFAENLGAERLELANVQFYGWANANRTALLPGREALMAAQRQIDLARQRLQGKMEILYVLPDSLAERPKPCMGGWGRRQLTVNPVGDVLPCPTAGCISTLQFENVRLRSLQEIWEKSDAFNRFRGTDWMPDPCRSCELRDVDFGGCRCQSYLLTGDAAQTDPACGLSKHHQLMTTLADSADELALDHAPLTFRLNPQRLAKV